MKNIIAISATAVETLFIHKNSVALLEERLGENHRDTIAALKEMDAFIETIPLSERICVYDVVKSTVGVNGVNSIAYKKLIEKLTTDVSRLDWNNSNKEVYTMVMRSLRVIRRNQGYFDDSESYIKELEQEKPLVALQTKNDLAVLCSKMGKFEEALNLFKQCLDIWKNISAQNYLDAITSIDSSESIFRNNVIYAEALNLYTKWLLLTAEEKHPYIVTLKNNMAVLNMKMGNYKEALELFDFCLGCRIVLLQNHPETLATMINLAELYDMIGEHDKAKDLYENSLNASIRILKENYPLTARFMGNLDKLAMNAKKYRESLPLFTDYLSLREAVLGTTCLDTHQSMNDLGESYKRMGRYYEQILFHNDSHELKESDEKSEELYHFSFRALGTGNFFIPPPEDTFHENKEYLSRSNLENNIVWLAFVEEALRMKDPDPLTMVNNVAYLCMKLGKYDMALPLFTNCLAMREEVLGKKHPDTLQSIRNLAELLKCMGKYYDALPLYVKYSSFMETLFGCRHPYCIEINKDLSLLYNEVGEYDKALCIYKENALPQNIPSISSADSHCRFFVSQTSYSATLRYGFKYTLSSLDKRSKHTSYVNAVCATMKYIVSASDDRRILVWEVVNDRIEFRRELCGHAGHILCLYVLKDDNINILNEIFSASLDGTIKRWDLDKGECVQSIKYDDYSVNECLAVICNEKYIFKGVKTRHLDTKKGLIHIFDVKLGGFINELAGHTDYARCFAMTSKYLFSGSLDKSIRRWDLDSITNAHSKRSTKEFFGHTDWVRSLCCTKDESRLISGSNDMTVRIWDIQTGETIQKLTVPNSRIRCVCLSDDNKQIICGGVDKTIRTWDLETGCPIRVLRGHTDWVTSVCGIPGTNIILSCSSDKDVILWDTQSSPILVSLLHKNENGEICPVLSLCQHNDDLLITCTKNHIYVWDTQQQYMNKSTDTFSDMMGAEISCICENKSNKSVIICCNYKSRNRSTLFEWFANIPENYSMKSRDYRGVIKCVCSCVNYIIIGFTQKNAVLINEFISNSIRERTIDMGNSIPLSIECVCVDSSCSSVYIIVLSQSKDILMWKYDGSTVTKSFVLTGHTYPVRCLTHSNNSDDKYIISGSDDYTLKLWRLSEEDTYDTVVEVKAEYSFEGHASPVTSVLCVEELIISGSADKTIIIWSLKARKILRTLIGHTSDITGLQISVANHLISVSKDGTMKVWDLSVGHNVPSDAELRELILLKHKEYGYCEQVTDIIKAMSTDNSIAEVINLPSLSSGNKKNNKVWEHTEVPPKPTSYNMSGFLKSFQLLVDDSTMDLVPEGCQMIPLVHWMSCQPFYRNYLLNLVSAHPELLYTRTEAGKTLFKAVQKWNIESLKRLLEVFSVMNLLTYLYLDNYSLHDNQIKI